MKTNPSNPHLMRRPPPVAQEVEKSLLGKPLANSVKRLSDDIKAALSSENLSRLIFNKINRSALSLPGRQVHRRSYEAARRNLYRGLTGEAARRGKVEEAGRRVGAGTG